MVSNQKTLVAADFGWTANAAVVTGSWNRLGTAYTVKAQTMLALGQDNPLGFAYVYLFVAAQVHGKMRLVASNAEETKKVVLAEFSTRETTDAGDVNKKKAIPLKRPFLREDSKLILEVDPEASATLAIASCIVQIPVTVFS